MRQPLALSDQAEFDPDSSRMKRLIASARDGDGDALGELLATYRNYLVFLARSGLHQQVRVKIDASDIAQEVCLAAHGKIGDFRGESAEQFAAWLRAILTNTLRMNLRRHLGTEKRNVLLEHHLDRSLSSASDFLNQALIADLTSPSQQFARNEAFLTLATALESLPEDYRRVIVLRHMEGLPFAQVAQSMNRTVNSVEKLWVRALARLRTAVSES